MLYLIPLRFARREARWLLAGSLLVTAAGDIAFGLARHGVYRPGGTRAAAGLLLESGLLLAGAWMIGYLARLQRAYSAGLREQAEQQAREELAEARRANSEERLRIARELHDVVAHSMSVIAVQAGVANYVAGTRPEEAARALSSIEETSRGALREMRALLGVLRNEETPGAGPGAGLIPAPGLADLKTLADRTADARRTGGPGYPRRPAAAARRAGPRRLPGHPGGDHQRDQACRDGPLPGRGRLR